ncbi:hypothetical protein [Arthrobacter silvisoli]|uniref:hypothetical protein n=1 Tax=Arthrobacter silvisoli TaxID=2291022 RepID=UPI00109B9F2D|nr:hypothetical protein [Arthrobacter silvisoli]
MKSSKATWRAVFSMFGPYAVANMVMIAAIVVFAVFQPDLHGPPETWTATTIWSAATIVVLVLTSFGFVVKGALRLRLVYKEAREDRRRIAAGLPLNPEEPE